MVRYITRSAFSVDYQYASLVDDEHVVHVCWQYSASFAEFHTHTHVTDRY